MKKTLAVPVLLGALIVANVYVFSQDDPLAARKEAAAASDAAARTAEAKDTSNDKARQSFINGIQRESLSNVASMESRNRAYRAKENELKFTELQQSAKELMDLGVKTYNQINSSGAQAVSLTVYSDLDRMEQLLKTMKKNIK